MSILKDLNTQTVNIDVLKGTTEKIVFNQHETTGTIRFQFKNGNDNLDLSTITSIRAYMLKPDNTKCFVNLEVENALEGTAILNLTNNILAMPGRITANLILKEGETDNKFITKFAIICRDVEYDEEVIESSNEFSALDEALKQIESGETSFINQKDGSALKIWAGSQSEFDELTNKYDDIIYLIDNNTTVLCTDIALNESEIEFTSNTPQTLTVTLTPSNTTESVKWTTNDSSVATVTGGVVTPVSNGSAIITATCGSMSATCNVTVNIALETSYSITNNLTNVTTNNSAYTITSGSTYTATLTPSSNYTLNTVTVTMGGTDITSTCYSDGVISITSVTGDIVITANATSQSEEEDNIVLNYYYSSDGTLTTNNQDSSVNLGDISSLIYREVSPDTEISITTPTVCKHTICEYDENKNFIQRNKNTETNLTTYSITTSSTTKYVRIGIGGVRSDPDKLDVFKEVYNNTTVSGMAPSVCNTNNITTEV